MIQNRDGQKIVGGTDAAEGEIGWQVRLDVYTATAIQSVARF